MIYSWVNRYDAILQIQEIYPNLQISEEKEDLIALEGSICINRKTSDFTLYKEYKVKILIFKDENKLPQVYDIGCQINSDYPHRYEDGMLCLDTDVAMKIRYEDGMDLCSWMQDFVEAFYFSYEYFRRNGEYPFGERKHGSDGVIETYSGYFRVMGKANVLNCIRYIAVQNYDGHDQCPCGSKKYIRKCHGKYILPFYNNRKRLEIVKNDYEKIMKEVFLKQYAARSGKKAK